ncbi:MAG: hypothetical protein ACKVP0_18545 [Pirellulaceae bacterium]
MTSTLHACPDCGARLKPSDKQCWLCNANPFGDKSGERHVRYKTNQWAMLGHLLAILAILPATGVAFMTTCTVLLVADPQVARGEAEGRSIAYLVLCGISAVVVFAGFSMLIASLRQKTVYRVE